MKHLTSKQIQEFLDQGLAPQEEARVREHLSVCPHCQSEAEAWSLLFTELGSLPQLDPGPGFLQDVLGQAPVRSPAGSRVRSWLAARKARRLEEAHAPPGSLQDHLEGLLAQQPAARLEGHLAACSSCRQEAREWQSLLASFGSLQRFAPSPGFAERVMAQVRVPAPAPLGRWSALRGRALEWVRSRLPRTRRGWAVAGGVASAPTIIMGTLAYAVFSHPLLDLGTFASYLALKASALLETMASAFTGGLVESVALFRAYSFLEPFSQSPLLLGVGGLVFSLLSAGALWVLYRNLIVTHSDDRYARARV